jgi:hypothetical protein
MMTGGVSSQADIYLRETGIIVCSNKISTNYRVCHLQFQFKIGNYGNTGTQVTAVRLRRRVATITVNRSCFLNSLSLDLRSITQRSNFDDRGAIIMKDYYFKL